MCGKPSQDCYAVPPEWLRGPQPVIELLVFNAAAGYCVPTASSFSNGQCTNAKQNGMLPPPPNGTRPELASVVMRQIGSGPQEGRTCITATHDPPVLGECCPGGPLSGPCGGGDDSWCQGVNGSSELPLSCQARSGRSVRLPTVAH